MKNSSESIKTSDVKSNSDTIIYHNYNGINHFARDCNSNKVKNLAYYLGRVVEVVNKEKALFVIGKEQVWSSGVDKDREESRRMES